MTGLVKQKEYNWLDSNLEFFGSSEDKAVKKSSAEGEPAWQPVLENKSAGLYVWRIEKFKVKSWPKEDYGRFFNGDSYIVLKVTKAKDSDELLYDAHFWIGKESTQDEYGTAAYKTVELDTILDDKAVQHREVQDYESDLFKSYFPVLTILNGGCASGFRHVEPESYKPRLLHFKSHGARHIHVMEVTFSRNALTPDDVFILDLGKEAWQLNGEQANKDERIRAAQYLQQLESDRNGRCKTEVFDAADISKEHRFYDALPDVEAKPKVLRQSHMQPKMMRLSNESGKLNFSLVAEGALPKKMMDDNDVYVIDNGKTCFIYVGAAASDDEKKNALAYATTYLQSTDHPLIAIVALKAGQKSDELNKLLE